MFSFDQTSIAEDASPRSRILNKAKLFLSIEDFLRRGGIVPKRNQPEEQGKTMSSRQFDGARALDCFWEGAQYFVQQQVVAGSREPVRASPKEGMMIAIVRSLARTGLILSVLLLVAFPAGALALTQILPEATSKRISKASWRSSAPSIERRKLFARANLMRSWPCMRPPISTTA